MLFNKKNSKQKNWRMRKIGKLMVSVCTLVVFAGVFTTTSLISNTIKVYAEKEEVNSVKQVGKDVVVNASQNDNRIHIDYESERGVKKEFNLFRNEFDEKWMPIPSYYDKIPKHEIQGDKITFEDKIAKNSIIKVKFFAYRNGPFNTVDKQITYKTEEKDSTPDKKEPINPGIINDGDINIDTPKKPEILKPIEPIDPDLNKNDDINSNVI